MKRIALIGSGISGMAAVYYLSRKYEVSLFEKENRLGGHTHTIPIQTESGPVHVDTGFIVHNDRTYPNLVRLFRELGVQTQPSDMSFSVSCSRTGLGIGDVQLLLTKAANNKPLWGEPRSAGPDALPRWALQAPQKVSISQQHGSVSSNAITS